MIDTSFDYAAPTSTAEAAQMLSTAGATALAGGQSLLTDLKLGELSPSLLVDLRGITALRGITEGPGGGTRIGAMSTLSDVARSRIVPAALARIAGSVSDPAVRNRATLGGNVALSDRGTDLPPVLMALGATITALTGDTETTIPVADLPGRRSDDPAFIVTSVEVPGLGDGERLEAASFSSRPSQSPVCTVAAWIRQAPDGIVTACRIAASTGPGQPARLTATETALTGQPLTRAVIEDACARVDTSDFTDDLTTSGGFRAHLAGVLAGRILGELAEG